jgi:2-phosphosulfolactate phosphatase
LSTLTAVQHPRISLAWGQRGTIEAAERRDILVIVDTLRFSTTAATAVAHGGLIYPCLPDVAIGLALARRIDGELAWPGRQSHGASRFSLSPQSFATISPGTRAVLPSLNGASCCQYGKRASVLVVGAIVNATAVAQAVTQMLETQPDNVTVVACGERWPTSAAEGALRFALEDYLGAGAILAALPFPQTMEAQVCGATFHTLRHQLELALWECDSGQELRMKALAEDVRFAAQHDSCDCVPVLRDERLEALT